MKITVREFRKNPILDSLSGAFYAGHPKLDQIKNRHFEGIFNHHVMTENMTSQIFLVNKETHYVTVL